MQLFSIGETIDLMKKELGSINSINIEKKAERLYLRKINYPEDPISKRCLEYLKLENEANKYL